MGIYSFGKPIINFIKYMLLSVVNTVYDYYFKDLLNLCWDKWCFL